VLAYLQRRWSLRVEKGLGSSLPPTELARRDSALLGKWNAYFLLRWRIFFRKSHKCFSLKNTHRTLGQTASDAKATFDECKAMRRSSTVRWSVRRVSVGRGSDTVPASGELVTSASARASFSDCEHRMLGVHLMPLCRTHLTALQSCRPP